MPSLGQREQERAWRRYWTGLHMGKLSLFQRTFFRYALRPAFDAGVEHGLELRGCCDHGERDES